MDQLSGLPSRHDLPAILEGLLAQSPTLSAIFFDIDGFIWVTDQLGYREGDLIITKLGRWLSVKAAELNGHALRIAGEEFLLLLPKHTITEALTIAHLMVRECEDLRLPYLRLHDKRDFLAISALVFSVSPDLPTKLAEFRDTAADALYFQEVAEQRNYSIVTQLKES